MSEAGRSKAGTPAGASIISGAAPVSPKPELNGSQRQSPDLTEGTPRTHDGSEFPSVAGTE